MFHLRFLLQGVDVGFVQLLFRTGGGTVGLELGAVVRLLKKMPGALGAVYNGVRSFHPHIVIPGIPDFPAKLPADCGSGGVGDFELRGRLLFGILKMELHLDFAVAVIGNQLRLDNLFGGDFCLSLLCLVSSLFRFLNGFSHNGIKPLFIGELQPGFTQKYHLPELPGYGYSSFLCILLLV